MQINEQGINTENWWFNETSGLYLLNVDNDPQERQRGGLAAGYFRKGMFDEIRPGVPFNLGIESGIQLSIVYSAGPWTGHETVFFDPSNEVEQISARRWRDTEDSMEFKELSSAFASRIYYHKNKFYDVPKMNHRHLDGAFRVLEKLESRKNMLRVVK